MNFLIQLIVGVIVTLASTLFKQASNTEQQKASGTQGSSQAGGKVAQSFLIGSVGDGGKLEYPRSTWGQAGEVPNAYLTTVLSFGDLPITGFTGLFVDGEVATVSTGVWAEPGYAVPNYNRDGANHLWWRFYDGLQAVADSLLTSKFGTDPDRPWLADMIGRGVPYLVITALWRDELWASSAPAIIGQFQGIGLYDPRKDSTAGGLGVQRWGQSETYQFSDNSFVIIYNILRGIYYEGRHFWGGRCTAAQLPYAEWAAAMDACDEGVSLANGAWERRYRGGRRINVDEEPRTVISEFLVGSNGRIAYGADGMVWPLVGVPAIAAGAFTDADVLATEELGSIPLPRLDDLINGATATYREPLQAWGSKETAPYYRSDLEAEDDGRRQTSTFSLDTTFSGTQAQRVLKAIVEEARRFGTHVVALPAPYAQFRPLQALAWTSDRFGYGGKLFLITARTRPIWGWVVFGLQEIDPADGGWNPGTDEKPLSFAPVVTNRPAPQEVSGPSVAPVPGTLAYDVFWSAPSVAVDVQFVRVSHQRPDGTLPYTVLVPKPDLLTGAARIPVSIELSGQTIEVQIEYLPYSGRSTVASAWMPVTIANVTLPPGIVDVSNLAKDVLKQIGTNRQVIETFKQIGTLLEEADRENYTKRESLFREVEVKLGTLQASFTEIIEVALDPEGDSALGIAIQQLRAAMGGSSAEINVRWDVAAAPSGFQARYVIQLRETGGTERQVNLFLDLPEDPTKPGRIGFMAGQTVFFTSGGVPIVLIDEDGFIRSANNAVVINTLNGDYNFGL